MIKCFGKGGMYIWSNVLERVVCVCGQVFCKGWYVYMVKCFGKGGMCMWSSVL